MSACFGTQTQDGTPGTPGTGDTTAPVEEKEPDPFNFETEMTEEDVAYLMEADDFVTLASSTPYYVNKHSLSVPAIKEFDDLKRAKVKEAQNLTDELYKQVQKLEADLVPFKAAYHSFLDAVYDKEEKIEDFAKDSAVQLMKYTIKEATLNTQIKTGEAQRSDDPLMSSFLEYEKTTKALELASVLYEDLGYLVSNSAQLNTAFGGKNDQEIQEALKTFTTQMEKLEELNPTLTAINQKSIEVEHALKQLDTADYYIGMASISFVEEQMPNVQKELEKVQASDQLTAEDIQFIKDYTEAFDTFNADMKTEMAKVEKSNLLLEGRSAETGFIPVAHADFMDNVSSAFNSFRQGVNKTVETTRLVWGKTKTVAGVTLDIVDANTQTLLDVSIGLYQGDDLSLLARDVAANYRQIGENYDRGSSGSEILRTGYNYLEGLEKGADEFAAQQVANQIGEGKISWGIGKVAKLTTGLFTQLGKGIYKVADTQATLGDTVEGGIDIAFSFVGGSQVILKGSQIVKGGKVGLQQIANRGTNFVKNTWNNARLTDLRAIYDDLIKNGGDEAADLIATLGNNIAKREAIEQTIKASREEVSKALADAVRQGGKNILENIKGIGGNYRDFVKEAYDIDNIREIISAIRDVLGKTGKDYFDNLAGNVIDDAIKGAIKDMVDEIFGKLGGTYSGILQVEELGIPIALEVDGTAITGDISSTFDFEIFDEPIHVKLTADVDGNINETFGILCNITGTAIVTTDGKTERVGFTGYFDGTVGETHMDVTNLFFVTEDGNFGPLNTKLTKH